MFVRGHSRKTLQHFEACDAALATLSQRDERVPDRVDVNDQARFALFNDREMEQGLGRGLTVIVGIPSAAVDQKEIFGCDAPFVLTTWCNQEPQWVLRDDQPKIAACAWRPTFGINPANELGKLPSSLILHLEECTSDRSRPPIVKSLCPSFLGHENQDYPVRGPSTKIEMDRSSIRWETKRVLLQQRSKGEALRKPISAETLASKKLGSLLFTSCKFRGPSLGAPT